MNTNNRKKGSLALNKETVRQLENTTLDQVGGGQGKLAFSGGPQCTGGIACTFNWSCSCACQAAA